MSSSSRILKLPIRMTTPKKTVDAIDAEWREIQAAQRNPALFRPLYNRYYEQIFRFIYRRTTDEMVAADVCSQVFLKALQKIKSYRHKGVPFSAWLYRIASNEIAQHYRNVQKRRVVSIEDNGLSDIVDEIKEDDFEDKRAALLSVIDRLRPDEVTLLELRFFEQRPFKEISQIMNITESNAKVKTYRLLDKMKKLMS